MDAIERYFELMKAEPTLFETHVDDGIRLVLNASSIFDAQARMSNELEQKGAPKEYATIGVVFEDQYIILLRDAVEFPNGEIGTYIRIVHKQHDHAGIVVLPETEQGFVLIRHFRHATRKWHWEAPRGFANTSNPSDTVIMELQEEIGAVPSSITRIGTYYPDSGLLASCVHVYHAAVTIGETRDDIEPISSIRAFSWEEMQQMVCSGDLNDGFTLAAISLMAAQLNSVGTEQTDEREPE